MALAHVRPASRHPANGSLLLPKRRALPAAINTQPILKDESILFAPVRRLSTVYPFFRAKINLKVQVFPNL
jgi:hypothetical protein